ncbi:hypothetical protein SKAU_G00259150 [Synaphobranchus kaupii]|uniref:Uncharacterized protein n=1 Tax=Synaphobranchus kaupii TaxID=118154 RepID=A0A9Q1F4R0_SYNKA|nr:hypothetical protein SKAU_G00259150 [Synaphobranchus kaupii]
MACVQDPRQSLPSEQHHGSAVAQQSLPSLGGGPLLRIPKSGDGERRGHGSCPIPIPIPIPIPHPHPFPCVPFLLPPPTGSSTLFPNFPKSGTQPRPVPPTSSTGEGGRHHVNGLITMVSIPQPPPHCHTHQAREMGLRRGGGWQGENARPFSTQRETEKKKESGCGWTRSRTETPVSHTWELV